MLKNLVISGLTVLTLFMYSGSTYSQNSGAMYQYAYAQPVIYSPNAHLYVPNYMWDLNRPVVIYHVSYAPLPSNDPYYKYENVHEIMYVPDPPERAVIIRTGTVSNSDYVMYTNYVRPSLREPEPEVNYLEPMVTPIVSGTNKIGVAPHGYNYYTAKKNTVIRDFRAEIWLSKTYNDINAAGE